LLWRRATPPRDTLTYKNWFSRVHKKVINKKTLDNFFRKIPNNNWGKFDPELGYILKDSILRDGADKAHSIYRYEKDGSRTVVNFPRRKCRINTYGDSFTQCHQVSDGETWQQYLSSHLGEPIRNYGVGGYGVYQAYLRLKRKEKTAVHAKYVILNIWGNDHHRSMMPWRGFQIQWLPSQYMYHANPWAYLEFNRQTGQIEEKPNPCPTKESLYKLLDAEYAFSLLKDNITIQVTAIRNGVTDIDSEPIRQLAKKIGYPKDLSDRESIKQHASAFLTWMAFKGTLYLLEKTYQFTQKNNQKLLLLFTHGSGKVAAYIRNKKLGAEYIRLFDYLKKNNIPYLDTREKHWQDYQSFKIPVQEYLKRYYYGHYKPAGNHFMAYAIKGKIVGWLNPKPITYSNKGSIIFFDKDYLQED